MANHESAIKRHRQSLKRRTRNRSVRAAVRSSVKKARTAIASKDNGAKESVRAAEKALASAGSKGVFHKKKVRRQISRLAKKAAQASKSSK